MESKSVDRVTLLNITIFVEAFLLLAATIWAQVAEISLRPLFHANVKVWVIGAAAGLLVALLSLLLMWLGKYLSFLAELRQISLDQIAPIFADLSFVDVVFISAVSGFCEEVFFRGAVQAQIGLLPAACVFGLFHCPSLKHASYGLWALVAGIFLGFLVQFTGSLWTPIIAHALSNAISLLYLRKKAQS